MPLVSSPQFLAATATALLALSVPCAGASQDSRVAGALSVELIGTRLAGHSTVLVGGQVSVLVGSGISIGGFGYGMPESIRLVEGAVPEDLRLGYGGLAIGLTLGSSRRVGVRSSILVGAGNAQVHAQPIGNQLGSDNFLVIEPRLTLLAPTGSRLRGEAGFGYRVVKGVQDLPRLDVSDLRGWTLTLSLSLGGLK